MKPIEVINSTNATRTEQLSAILRTMANRNPEEDARALIDHFGTLKNVLEAPEETLSNVVSKSTAAKLATVLPIVRMYERELAMDAHLIANRNALEHFCKGILEGEQVEKFLVVAVNAQCKVIGYKVITTGSISEVAAYPRIIAKYALDVNAHSVFLSHNHPGGTCAPSKEDIATTIQIKRTLATLDILTLDHMIIAGNKGYSFAANGDMEFN